MSDKYRLKAHEVINAWWALYGHKNTPPMPKLERVITEALIESAREATERAAEIAKSHTDDDKPFSVADRIAEAIRKEMS